MAGNFMTSLTIKARVDEDRQKGGLAAKGAGLIKRDQASPRTLLPAG